MKPSQRDLPVCCLLFAVTMHLYGRTAWHAFINYDDQIYVIDNARVATGLAWEIYRSGRAIHSP